MRLLLFGLCLLTQAGFAQTGRIDSLKRVLIRLQQQPQSYSRDTLSYQTLRAITRAYTDVNVDSSVYYNTLMISLCSRAALQRERIYAYQYAGYLHQVKGDYDQAIPFHYKALSLAEKLKQYPRIAASYGGLAHTYASLNEFARAVRFCEQGLAILRHHPDTYVQVSILNTLGGIYREQGRLHEALTTNQTLYQLAKAHHHAWYESQGLHAIGWVYREMGDLTKALRYYENALILCRHVRSVDLEGSILLHITDVYVQQNAWPQALRFCKLARQKANQVRNSSLVAEADEKLYKIYKQTGQTANALAAYEAFVVLKDSLSKETNQQRIEMLQAQYDNVQKTNALQRERVERLAQQNRSQQLAQTRNGLLLGTIVALFMASLLFWNNRRLQAKNREIDRQRTLLETARQQLADVNKSLETRVDQRTAELVSANRELIQKNEDIKEALFKGQTIERKRVALELHDNLSSLLSAVNMSIQSINPQNLSEAERAVYQNVKHLIQNAYAEVRNISHNILPAELEREGLATTLTALIDRLNQNSAVQFTLTSTGLRERLPVEIEFNVYSIVLELVNNAIKHAQATTVGINLLRTGSGVNLSITDDGVGLGQHQTKRGVGLQNIQTRLDSLGGTFTILLPTERGTRIHINIPIETVRLHDNVHLG